MKVRALVVLAALVFGACNQEEPPPPPGSFDRPTRVAFVCFETKDIMGEDSAAPTALENCAKSPPANSKLVYSLHALVVQSSRGEVAAVDLGAGRTLDSRADIPGYTFLPVGELPTAIVVPAREVNSRETYVANAGSRDISVLKTATFRVRAALEIPTLQTVPLPGGSRDVPQDMVLSPDEDALFVSMPNAGRLLRLPIVRCGDGCLMDGLIDADHITELPLARSLERAVASAGGEIDHGPYAKTCSYSQPIPNSAAAVPVPPADSPAPRPGGMAVDDFCETGSDKPCKRRLLVSDSALPLIHVIDLDELAASGEDAAVQAPILTGVPTTSVAVTPRVPTEINPDAGETQYVYAIDATDGSLLVTEDGKLLEVGATDARKDRVTLSLGPTLPHLTAMTVFTPAFDIHGPAAQYTQESTGTKLEDPSLENNWCVDTFITEYSKSRLRGVFLAVGATDGTVRIIDVHDMDSAHCRNCDQHQKEGCICNPDAKLEDQTDQCDACQATWDPYPLVRHRPRIIQPAIRQVPNPTLAPIASPFFVSGSLRVDVRSTGTTADPAIKGLDCVRCANGQQAAFPADGTEMPNDDEIDRVDAGMDAGMDAEGCDPGSALVCALADPWTQLDAWRAEYMGVLPGANGGQGRFEKLDQNTPEFRGEVRFCGVGALGADQLAKRTGDQLSILGALPPDDTIRKTAPTGDSDFNDKVLKVCKDLIERRDSTEDNVPIAFEIRAAYADRLELSPTLTSRPPTIDPDLGSDVEIVNKCFGNKLLSYEIRSGSGYIVVGSKQVGFEHRVKAAEGSGHCEIDTSLDPKRDGRAYEGEPFDNGRVTFQATSGGATKPGTVLALALSVLPGTTTTTKAEMSLSIVVNERVTAALPVDIRWSAGDPRLFVVDVSYRGLLPVLVTPFNPQVGGSFD